jgi:hypothetical protein
MGGDLSNRTANYPVVPGFSYSILIVTSSNLGRNPPAGIRTSMNHSNPQSLRIS